MFLSYKLDLFISAGKHDEMIRIKDVKPKKRQYLPNYWSDKGSWNIGNLPLLYLHEGSLKLTHIYIYKGTIYVGNKREKSLILGFFDFDIVLFD